MATGLNILVVEDNDDLRDSIVAVLGAMGHSTRGASCAESLSDEGATHPIDLLVVDLNLPGEDGLSLARRLRGVQPSLSILMLTARSSTSDKVNGYEAGADIYLTKPVSIEELSAAVRSIERRFLLQIPHSLDQAGIKLDIAGLRIHGPDKSVALSAVEVALLSALARAPGRRLAYWQLLEIMVPEMQVATHAVLAVRMTRLRKKLAETGIGGTTIQAVRQEGCYQLCIAVRLI